MYTRLAEAELNLNSSASGVHWVRHDPRFFHLGSMQWATNSTFTCDCDLCFTWIFSSQLTRHETSRIKNRELDPCGPIRCHINPDFFLWCATLILTSSFHVSHSDRYVLPNAAFWLLCLIKCCILTSTSYHVSHSDFCFLSNAVFWCLRPTKSRILISSSYWMPHSHLFVLSIAAFWLPRLIMCRILTSASYQVPHSDVYVLRSPAFWSLRPTKCRILTSSSHMPHSDFYVLSNAAFWPLLPFWPLPQPHLDQKDWRDNGKAFQSWTYLAWSCVRRGPGGNREARRLGTERALT